MTSISCLHSRATPDLSFTILLDLRQVTRNNCRKFCRFWRRKQSRQSAACYLVSLVISAYILATDGQWKVLFCSEQCLATIATWNRVFWDGEGRKRFLSPHLSSSRLTLYSACHSGLYQVRWSDDSDLWHRSRWRCQLPICGRTSGKKVQKTFVWVCLSTARRCLLRRQVLVNFVPKCRPDGSTFSPMQICILPEQVNIRIRWKCSSERWHPLLIIPLSSCYLFQCSKIILSSVFNMQ